MDKKTLKRMNTQLANSARKVAQFQSLACDSHSKMCNRVKGQR